MTSKETVTDLRLLMEELLGQAATHHSHRAASTLVFGPLMRATAIALTAGAELAEHDSPPAASLHVLTGTVRLYSGADEWLLSAGQLVAIPSARHGLTAITDAVVLLTVALA